MSNDTDKNQSGKTDAEDASNQLIYKARGLSRRQQLLALLTVLILLVAGGTSYYWFIVRESDSNSTQQPGEVVDLNQATIDTHELIPEDNLTPIDFVILGNAHLGLEDYGQARAAYQQARQMEGGESEIVIYALAEVERLSGNTQQSVDYYNQLLELVGDENPEAREKYRQERDAVLENRFDELNQEAESVIPL